MYEPTHFRVEERTRLHQVMVEHPLGLLVSSGEQGLLANALPFTLVPELGPKGTLRAHLARANPQWRDFTDGLGVLVVFQGVDRYISPALYASKAEHGKVVPTWNYVMVQARGRIMVYDNPTWLRAQLGQLTQDNERLRAKPWAVGDAPDAFVAAQMRAIVGIEIEIADLRGKFKVSQNKPARDQASVLAALESSGAPDDMTMAGLLRQSMAGE